MKTLTESELNGPQYSYDDLVELLRENFGQKTINRIILAGEKDKEFALPEQPSALLELVGQLGVEAWAVL